MTFLRNLFGGSEQEQRTEVTPVDVTPGPLAEVRQPFSNVLRALLGEGGQDPLAGIPESPGPRVAGLAGPEADFLTRIAGGVGGDPQVGQARDLISQVLGGEFLPGAEGANPLLRATIEAAQRPTLEGLTETLERALPGRFTRAGQFIQPQGSSPFDRASAIASRGAAQALGDIATRIGFGAFESERGRQTQAVTQATQIASEDLNRTISGLQASALPRLIEQAGLDKGTEEFRNRITALLQTLQIITGAPISQVAQQQVSTGTGVTRPNIIGTLVKGAEVAFPKGI